MNAPASLSVVSLFVNADIVVKAVLVLLLLVLLLNVSARLLVRNRVGAR